MMQLVLIILTKRKATVAKDLDKHFYRSNESQCTYRKQIIHLHHGFSLTSPYNGLFTNKFLHVKINNKIILINRKEACTSPNSSTKTTNNKISP
jgi:hypothetical protein